MKTLCSILVICTFSSCFLWKSSAEKVRREAVKDSIAANKACMDSLKAFVAKNWTYHQDGDYYSCTKEFIRDIANTYIPSSEPGRSIRFERCLGILDRTEIIELLGKPTYPNRILRYNLDKGGEYEGEFLRISLEKGRRHIMIAHISSIE